MCVVWTQKFAMFTATSHFIAAMRKDTAGTKWTFWLPMQLETCRRGCLGKQFIHCWVYCAGFPNYDAVSTLDISQQAKTGSVPKPSLHCVMGWTWISGSHIHTHTLRIHSNKINPNNIFSRENHHWTWIKISQKNDDNQFHLVPI